MGEDLPVNSKSFVFNRNSDWSLNSCSVLTEIKKDRLVFLPDNEKSSVFFSKCLDSDELGTSWGILSVKLNSDQNSKLVFRLFASDSKEILTSTDGDLKKINIDSFLEGNSDFNTKIDLFDELKSLKFENRSYAPLFGLKGRYLWFCIESKKHSNNPVEIEEMEITFPCTSFVEYLPEIYQSLPPDSFMNRFVSIFQKMYSDIESTVDNIPENFEPLYTNKEFILWICRWFNINSMAWDDSKLRYLIFNVLKIFKSRGTRKSILDVLEVYIGSKPILVEKIGILNNEFYEKRHEFVDKLFGENNFFFTVIATNRQISNDIEYANILKIIKNFSPLDAICNLVVLSDSISLGYHCYLGVNSYISNSYVKKDFNVSDSVMIVN